MSGAVLRMQQLRIDSATLSRNVGNVRMVDGALYGQIWHAGNLISVRKDRNTGYWVPSERPPERSNVYPIRKDA